MENIRKTHNQSKCKAVVDRSREHANLKAKLEDHFRNECEKENDMSQRIRKFAGRLCLLLMSDES